MVSIYLITNQLNDKTYVGQTERTLEKRFQEHSTCERKGLGVAIRKHGKENFTIQLLEETEEGNERETYWIKETKSYENGYNLCPYGDSTLNSKLPEVREKIRQAALRRVASGEWVSPSAGGHTEETKEKMRGKRRTNGHLGMKRTPEQRQRMSKASKGKRMGNQNAARLVVVEGVSYPSVKAAALAYGCQTRTIRRRFGV
jgi:group I intron endonuclease